MKSQTFSTGAVKDCGSVGVSGDEGKDSSLPLLLRRFRWAGTSAGGFRVFFISG